MRWRRQRTSVLAGLTLLAACGSPDEGPSVGGSAQDPVSERPSEPEPADEGGDGSDPADDGSDPGTSGDASLDDRVRTAVDHLAGTEDVDPSSIEVVAAEPTTWPDGSLGCPQPDIMYTPSLVEGYRIVLRVEGREVAYHGADGEPFRCDRPAEGAQG